MRPSGVGLRHRAAMEEHLWRSLPAVTTPDSVPLGAEPAADEPFVREHLVLRPADTVVEDAETTTQSAQTLPDTVPTPARGRAHGSEDEARRTRSRRDTVLARFPRPRGVAGQDPFASLEAVPASVAVGVVAFLLVSLTIALLLVSRG